MSSIIDVYLIRLMEKAEKSPDHEVTGFKFSTKSSVETNKIVDELSRLGFISRVYRYGRNYLDCYVTDKAFEYKNKLKAVEK